MAVKTATPKATERAIQILLESITEQNGTLDEISEISETQVLENRAEAMKLSLQLFVDGFWSHVANTHRQRNSFAAINRLPVEVLANIFHTASLESQVWWDKVQAADRYTVLHGLAMVSVRWNHIIRTTPSLWSIICSTHSPNLIPTILRRSKNIPLTISCDVSPNHLPWQANPYHLFKAQAQSLGHRWRAVYLQAPSIYDFHAFLDVAAPVLETMNLGSRQPWLSAEEGDARFPQGALVPFGGGRPPKLMNVSIRGITMQWDSPLFSNLLRLKLSDLTKRENGLRAGSIVKILMNCPRLVELRLLDLVVGEIKASEDDETIRLPNLTTLYLQSLPSTFSSRLLQKLEAPVREFVFECNPRQLTASALLDDTLPYVTSALKYRKDTLKKFNIQLGDGHFSFRYDEKGSECFRITFDRTYPSDPLQWLGKFLRSEFPSVPLSLTWEVTSSPFHEKFFSHLNNLTPIREIHIGTTPMTPSSLLRNLARPSILNRKPHWPFRDLEVLSFLHQSVDARDVLEMVRTRYGNGENSPQPLKSLEFHWNPTDLGVLQELKEALAGCKFKAVTGRTYIILDD